MNERKVNIFQIISVWQDLHKDSSKTGENIWEYNSIQVWNNKCFRELFVIDTFFVICNVLVTTLQIGLWSANQDPVNSCAVRSWIVTKWFRFWLTHYITDEEIRLIRTSCVKLDYHYQPRYFIKHKPSVLHYSLITLSLCVSLKKHMFCFRMSLCRLFKWGIMDCSITVHNVRSKVMNQ